ncbi:MAG: hypothetical protein AAF600_14255 [Bacteroidota bacterium]
MLIETDGKKPIEFADEFLKTMGASNKDKGTFPREKNILYLEESFFLEKDLMNHYSSLISDFQGASIDQLSEMLKDSTSSKSLFVLGQVNDHKNVFIDTLIIDFNPDDFSKQRIVLYPKVSGDSDENENIVFRLFYGKRQLSSIVTNTEDLRKVTFDIPLDVKGGLLVQIEGDDVYYDNEFRFILSEKEKPIISIIDSKNNEFIEAVFGNKDLFLSHNIDSKSIDYDLVKSSDVIVINAVSTLPSGLASQISDKTVIFFPTKETRDLKSEWMGLTIDFKNDTSRYEFDVDFNHPLFKGVFENNKNVYDLPSARSLANIEGNFELIISLRNGNPFLVKLTGRDHYFFNTKLDLNYTNFPTHALFLPLLYKIALSAVSHDDKVYYYPNDIAGLNVKNKEIPPKIVSENLEIIPEFTPSEAGIVYKVPYLEPDFYTLVHEKDTSQIAINISKEESIMQGLTLDELKENFGQLEHVTIQSTSSMQNLPQEKKIGKWKYVLFLVMFLLLIETMFHKYLR